MRLEVSNDPGSKAWIVKPDAPAGLLLDPELFQTGLPQPGQPLIASDVFSLIVATSGTRPTCQIRIDPSVNSFDLSELRPRVIRSYEDLFTRLDRAEGTGVKPGSTELIRSVMMTLVPATFAESLFFSYRRIRRVQPAPAQNSVDLRAGMRLRLECQFSQMVPATSADAPFPLANGYVAAGQAYFHVVEMQTSSRKPALSFDAFLGPDAVPLVDANTGGAAGLIDLQGPLMRRRYFRLCYPSQFASSDSGGSEGIAQNVTLLGADNLDTLNRASDTYFESRRVTDSAVVAAFFRGRTFVIPEILCHLNGSPTYVPVGTTVRQLLSRYTILPRVDGFRAAKFPYLRLAPASSFLSGGGNPLAPAYPDFYREVNFAAGTSSSGPLDAYDLPVFHGDSYNSSFAAAAI
jgi:hypothetical protein